MMTSTYRKGKVNLRSHGLHKYKNNIGAKFPKSMTPMIMEKSTEYMSTISVFDRLMADKIIFLGDVIDSETANIINAQFLYLDSEGDPKEPIWLYINSPGGEIYSGLAVYDTINMIGTPVYTCVMGEAASMAFVLATSGAKKHRCALPHSRLMMHQPIGWTGEAQATDIDIYNTEIKELKKDLHTIVAKNTGKDYETIFRDAERDKWMRSSEAQAYGAIDKIITKL